MTSDTVQSCRFQVGVYIHNGMRIWEQNNRQTLPRTLDNGMTISPKSHSTQKAGIASTEARGAALS